MDNNLKLIGEKANTKSTQVGKELWVNFGLRDSNIKRQTSTTALANKET